MKEVIIYGMITITLTSGASNIFAAFLKKVIVTSLRQVSRTNGKLDLDTTMTSLSKQVNGVKFFGKSAKNLDLLLLYEA